MSGARGPRSPLGLTLGPVLSERMYCSSLVGRRSSRASTTGERRAGEGAAAAAAAAAAELGCWAIFELALSTESDREKDALRRMQSAIGSARRSRGKAKMELLPPVSIRMVNAVWLRYREGAELSRGSCDDKSANGAA